MLLSSCFSLFNMLTAFSISSNPEDCLPSTGPGSHSRRPSRPPSGNVSPILTATQHPTSQTTSTGEAVYPVDSATSNCTNETHRSSPSHPRVAPTSHPNNPHAYMPFPPPVPPKPRGTRNVSNSGGVQMVLDETSSWSNLADHSSTVSESQGGKSKSGSNGGMFSFLSRKKGRERSPKPTEPGILGKEGARQIIN